MWIVATRLDNACCRNAERGNVSMKYKLGMY